MPSRDEGIGSRFHRLTRYAMFPGAAKNWEGLVNFPPPKKSLEEPKRFALKLPGEILNKPLGKVIAQRRSIRDFSQAALSFEELSQLLWAIQGITSRAYGLSLRACPSAGALYPVETYLAVNRVRELPSGIYKYLVEEAGLALLKEGDFGQQLCRAGLEQEFLMKASAVFIWTAVVHRSTWKYRDRAYRYIYMDAGHIGQNLYLAATALGLGCCTVGAFYDDAIDRIIEIDGEKEISLYLAAVGKVDRKN